MITRQLLLLALAATEAQSTAEALAAYRDLDRGLNLRYVAEVQDIADRLSSAWYEMMHLFSNPDAVEPVERMLLAREFLTQHVRELNELGEVLPSWGALRASTGPSLPSD